MTEDKTRQTEDFSLIENFVSALNIEFEEAKKSNVEKQITLENGERGEQLGSKVLYTFFLDQDLRIGRAKDDMPVQLIIGDENIDANIVSVTEKKVTTKYYINVGIVNYQE